MLGDGCILKRTAQSKFSFTSSKEDYAKWLANIFIKNGFVLTGNGVIKKTYFHKNWNSYYTKFFFSTLCYVELHEIENKWYKNRKKIVPTDLKISPKLMLHWYLGDGTLPKSQYAMFCTDCFTLEENIFLSQKINKEIGIKSSVSYNRIFIPKTSVPKLLKYMGKCPIKSLDYKWNLKKIGRINKPINIDINQLRELYLDKKLTTSKIADYFNCSQSLIQKKLSKFGIRKYDISREIKYFKTL